MALPRRTLLAGALAALSRPAAARPRPLRIGVLTTLSGPAADGAGQGSVIAARMAAEARPDLSVEILAADMGDRPDVGAGLARAWFDRDGVDAVLDVPNSATALAVAGLLALEKVGQPVPARAASAAVPKPGDTAVPSPTVTPGAASDEFEIDFDDEPEQASEEATVAVKPDARPPAPATKAAALTDDLSTTDEPIADDAIADFLLDLKLDDEE